MQRDALCRTGPGQPLTKASLQPYAWGTGTHAGDYAEAHPHRETLQRQTEPHLHLLQHGVVFYPWEENPHGVGTVIQKGDASPVQVVGQLVNVSLQLSEGWGGKSRIKQRIPESQHAASAPSLRHTPQHPMGGTSRRKSAPQPSPQQAAITVPISQMEKLSCGGWGRLPQNNSSGRFGNRTAGYRGAQIPPA